MWNKRKCLHSSHWKTSCRPPKPSPAAGSVRPAFRENGRVRDCAPRDAIAIEYSCYPIVRQALFVQQTVENFGSDPHCQYVDDLPIAKNRHPYREDRPGQDCSHNEIGDLRLASSNHAVVHFGICRARKRLPKWPVCAEELLSFGVVQYDGGSANLERCPHLAIESQKIPLL